MGRVGFESLCQQRYGDGRFTQQAIRRQNDSLEWQPVSPLEKESVLLSNNESATPSLSEEVFEMVGSQFNDDNIDAGLQLMQLRHSRANLRLEITNFAPQRPGMEIARVSLRSMGNTGYGENGLGGGNMSNYNLGDYFLGSYNNKSSYHNRNLRRLGYSGGNEYDGYF
ncbi:hypothetical protein B0H63DRAFT_490299 [Podospora didyma]|uniref:Uncharacterized protein n=1 Tax=Podospora didyma TaxID=330526 RepID=A0AAE0N174_9PEZI|nr:hypothetical protein B0H63DRAFT_490299 [Podospora didyma]